MKKITMSVAALSIALSSFGQCTVNPVEEECKVIHYSTIDLIDALRTDMYYGKIDEQTAGYYMEQILKLQKNVQSLVNVINQSQLAFDEEVSDYLNETLTANEWFELQTRIKVK